MKILHFFKAAMPDSIGGVEQCIHQIARQTAKKGHETHVLALTNASSFEKEMQIEGYILHRAKTDLHLASTGFSISALQKFMSLAKEMDVIHYHFPWPFMDIVHFISRVKKPTVVTYHSDIVKQKNLLKLYQPLMWRFLNQMECIVATSPKYVETSPVLACYPDKTKVIPIGLDRANYPPSSKELLDAWRAKLGEQFFLFVGVLRYYKGLNILLDAMKERDYPLVIIGSGPLELALKAQAEQLNLRHVHFLGQLSDADKNAVLSLCYAFVFPSHLRSEAFGISLLEAAMFGKPMISCEIGTGVSFVNQSRETGLVVPPENVLALGQAMDELWQNPKMVDQMGLAAERRYWQLFTAEKMAEDYISIYQKLYSRTQPDVHLMHS